MFVIDKSNNVRPYDVVYVHSGKKHFQPGCSFSTKESAELHLNVLSSYVKKESDAFILNHWPVKDL